MASNFEGWGDSGTPAKSWGDFYGSILSGGIGSNALQTINKLNSGADPVGKFPSFDSVTALRDGWKLFEETDDATVYVRPSGDGTADRGSAGSGSTGGDLFGIDLGSWVARIAIIILGFIFVAVGLSMFRDGA